MLEVLQNHTIVSLSIHGRGSLFKGEQIAISFYFAKSYDNNSISIEDMFINWHGIRFYCVAVRVTNSHLNQDWPVGPLTVSG